MTHGSPKDPLEEYIFPDSPDYVFLDFFNYVKSDVVIIGHTHIPFVKKINGKMVINPGSVGQPRDGDPRASYAVFNTDTRKVEIRRVSYNINEVAQRIGEVGLPERLAQRLFYGF
jgi:predicted phosphodiesterase